MASVILGVRTNPSQFQRIKLENVGLEQPVAVLKTEAAKKINTDANGIELSYRGLILEDESLLSTYGIKSGVMVHVLKKREPEVAPPVKELSEQEIQQLVVAFKAFTVSSSYRAALQRLSRKEVLDTIIAATPWLEDDPVAIAMVQDPELIVNLSDAETVRKVAKLHPSLIEAANYIAAHVHEEAASSNSTQPSTSTGYSYSLDALSDDEEMDSSSSDPPREVGHALSRNASYNAITAAQLAAAIATAQQNYTNSSSNNTGGISGSANAGNSRITSEMFSSAIQQAFASAPTTPNTPSTGVETPETLRTRLRPQLQQMREIGLTNEARNLRALQATGGNVQAAIDLVFNGVID